MKTTKEKLFFFIWSKMAVNEYIRHFWKLTLNAIFGNLRTKFELGIKFV